jgi:phage-related protein
MQKRIPLRFHIKYGMMGPMEETTPWSIEFYATPRGERPAEAYIDGLPARERAAIVRDIELLREFGVALGMPTARHIEGSLWELRPGPHRVFYLIVTGRRCILLCGYRKRGDKAPAREIARARRYMADWWEKERYG